MCAKPAIYAIGNHVHHQPDGNDACPGMKQQQEVYNHRRVAVQGMETDAATARIKHWRGKQVIQVYGHGEQQQQVCLEPGRPEE